MPRTIATICLTVLASLAMAGTASAEVAATSPDMTVNRALRIADRYWAARAPADPCHGMPATSVTADPTLSGRGAQGEATGLVPTWLPVTSTWSWNVAACAFTVAPNLSSYQLCMTVVHERGHLALREAGHTGMMAPRALHPHGCDRVEVIDDVRSLLPAPRAPWTIVCGPTASHMHCHARRSGSRERRFVAGAGPHEWVGYDQS